MNKLSEKYRVFAEDCSRCAARFTEPREKERWAKLAADWSQLADDATRRETRPNDGGISMAAPDPL
jgi:hypothetical protein